PELLALAVQEDPDGSRWTQLAIDMVDALPPVSAEAMAVPFPAARRWLEGVAQPESFDVEGAAVDDEDERGGRKWDRLRPPRPALIWQGDESRVGQADEIRPGQTLVVPAAYGGIAYANWAPESEAAVRDV